MTSVIDTLLLIALPASGKSELRRFLANLSPEDARDTFHLGETVQLDDYPYVHMMRRTSEILVELGQPGAFFPSGDQPFTDGRDWGTLVQLLNEDFDDLYRERPAPPPQAACWLLERLEAARGRAGAPSFLPGLPADVRAALCDRLEKEAHELFREKWDGVPESLDGKTVVIELARGGPEGSPKPLPAPYGYRYSFSQLSARILGRASVLYIWVEPEESRRKNLARAKPGLEGDASILHHGVPEVVMRGDYGTDDVAWLLEASDRPDTIRLEVHGDTFHLPLARFDNRVDRTTFIRLEPEAWPADAVAAIRAELKKATDRLAGADRS